VIDAGPGLSWGGAPALKLSGSTGHGVSLAEPPHAATTTAVTNTARRRRRACIADGLSPDDTA
jgi:hypothetical protein